MVEAVSTLLHCKTSPLKVISCHMYDGTIGMVGQVMHSTQYIQKYEFRRIVCKYV